jgi:hypothetical protein
METRLVTNPALPKIGRKLLAQLQSHELTMDQFLLECAMWMLETLDDMRFRPNPTIPEDMSEYYRQKQSDYNYKVDRSFWDQPHIRQYKAAESEIRAINRSNLYWLNEMQRLIPKDDQVNHAKIQRVMRGYPR